MKERSQVGGKALGGLMNWRFAAVNKKLSQAGDKIFMEAGGSIAGHNPGAFSPLVLLAKGSSLP